MIYSHRKIEQKWQKKWTEQQLFITDLSDTKRPKLYFLDMFPYPSGSGLHVGHLRGYLATDILTRMKRMQGFNVFHPIGFDSFGLPAEQYAMQTKKDPYDFTERNITYFCQQLQSFGFTYDFTRLVQTHHPQYYQWTQWIFLQLFKNNLAVLTDAEVNYCPTLNTVLANEEVVNLNGRVVSERGEHPVYRQQRQQWMLKITTYAPALLEGLMHLDWPEAIKKAQQHWIGKKEGYLLQIAVQNHRISLFVPLFKLENLLNSVDFVVLQINNDVLDSLLTDSTLKQLQQLRREFSQKPIVSKDLLDKTPVGLFSQLFAIHPLTNALLPIYFAEYPVDTYSYRVKLGMVNFDVQDWFFAQHHRILSSKRLEHAKKTSQSLIKDGNSVMLVEHPKLGTVTLDASSKIPFLSKLPDLLKDKMQKTTFYQLRDWVFARQRYWGEPFPIRRQNNQIQPLKTSELPLLLPTFTDLDLLFKDQSTPLANIKEWVASGYDVDTMPQWAGSCWYFLAYLLKRPDGTFWPLDSTQAQKLLNAWMPVDLYVGGAEHAVLHLLYARFWNLFLHKIGCHQHPEPFRKLRNPGLILANDGKKMSKSKGNVVNPNDFLISHGADALRLYQQFLGPFDKAIFWNEQGLDAMRKWLARVYRLFITNKKWFQHQPSSHLDYLYHAMVKKITQDYEHLHFNLVVSQLMVFINACYKSKVINWNYGVGFLQLLHPICPHLSEEIWSLWKLPGFLIHTTWPTYQSQYLQLKSVVWAIQINGKTKKVCSLPINLTKEQVINSAKEQVLSHLQNHSIQKIIFVANKIVNFVM